MKKLLMIFLLSVFTLGTTYNNQISFANSNDGYFEMKLNLEESSTTNNDFQNTLINESQIDVGYLKIQLDNNQECYTKVSGSLNINNEKYDILAEGTLEAYDVLGKEDYLKGLFMGHIYKEEDIVDEIVFDLHYNKLKDEYYTSSMTIGVIDDRMEKEPISLFFGNMDLELNKAFYEQYELGNTDHFEEYSTLIDSSKGVKEIPDYKLQEYDTLEKEEGNLMYIAAYHPSSIEDHTSASMYLRTWTNTDNILNYFSNHFKSYIVPNSVAVYKIKLKITGEDDDFWEVDDPTPDDNCKKFDMPLPIYLGSTLGYQLITVPIKTSSTEFEAYGDPNENKAKWYLEKKNNFFDDTDADSEKPWKDEDDENGIGVKCTFSYRAHVSSDVDKSINFYSKFYCRATEHKSFYHTKYLNFKHDIDSTIEVTE